VVAVALSGGKGGTAGFAGALLEDPVKLSVFDILAWGIHCPLRPESYTLGESASLHVMLDQCRALFANRPGTFVDLSGHYGPRRTDIEMKVFLYIASHKMQGVVTSFGFEKASSEWECHRHLPS
jgi:hypothetical protein